MAAKEAHNPTHVCLPRSMLHSPGKTLLDRRNFPLALFASRLFWLNAADGLSTTMTHFLVIGRQHIG
ncbi:MAG TPA: hypothetical protein VGV39_27215 [Mesorhizobium sp.]|jgi:hypothetical protein|uniref:hypothetical protein n=1 Tax=Mesorhizobium sp. TaxID=1871066 RepID=UPI002DDDB933|nr:hypothetical protein [Mesorhizobium sp.]HEV2506793.1 hypothetical protein [Mesorhizobium sp.]